MTQHKPQASTVLGLPPAFAGVDSTYIYIGVTCRQRRDKVTLRETGTGYSGCRRHGCSGALEIEEDAHARPNSYPGSDADDRVCGGCRSPGRPELVQVEMGPGGREG